jgi:hypothetical protein
VLRSKVNVCRWTGKVVLRNFMPLRGRLIGTSPICRRSRPGAKHGRSLTGQGDDDGQVAAKGSALWNQRPWLTSHHAEQCLSSPSRAGQKAALNMADFECSTRPRTFKISAAFFVRREAVKCWLAQAGFQSSPKVELPCSLPDAHACGVCGPPVPPASSRVDDPQEQHRHERLGTEKLFNSAC